jgi:hypothetical protein
VKKKVYQVANILNLAQFFLKTNRGVKVHLQELEKLPGQGFDDISFARVSTRQI